MNREEFENSESVKLWMENLYATKGTGSTKYQWKRKVYSFCEWLNKTPDELIEQRKLDLKNDDEAIKRKIERDVKRYLTYLEEERKLAPNTIRACLTAIKSFFQRNYVSLELFPRSAPRLRTVRKGVKSATKEDIRAMVEVSDPRVRALILFLKDTGLSISDVSKLKIKNLGVNEVSEVFSLEPPIAITTNRKKTGEKVITFLGREGFEALKTTFRIRIAGSPELRIRYGKTETKGIEPETLMLESPLFRSYGKYLASLKKLEPKHLNPNTISTLIRKSAILAGTYKEGFSAHALRRFFQTSLEHAGVSPNWIKRMMGHAMNGVEGSYSKPEIEMLREAYSKAYPHLAVVESVEQSARVEALEAQTEKLILNGKRREDLIEKQKQIIEEMRENENEFYQLLMILLTAKSIDERKAEALAWVKKMRTRA